MLIILLPYCSLLLSQMVFVNPQIETSLISHSLQGFLLHERLFILILVSSVRAARGIINFLNLKYVQPHCALRDTKALTPSSRSLEGFAAWRTNDRYQTPNASPNEIELSLMAQMVMLSLDGLPFSCFIYVMTLEWEPLTQQDPTCW